VLGLLLGVLAEEGDQFLVLRDEFGLHVIVLFLQVAVALLLAGQSGRNQGQLFLPPRILSFPLSVDDFSLQGGDPAVFLLYLFFQMVLLDYQQVLLLRIAINLLLQPLVFSS
jgi:hypothetical protein